MRKPWMASSVATFALLLGAARPAFAQSGAAAAADSVSTSAIDSASAAAILRGCRLTDSPSRPAVYQAWQVDAPARITRMPPPRVPGGAPKGQPRNVLRFIVDTNGAVLECSLTTVSEEWPRWTSTLTHVLLLTRFEPARLDGQPVRQWVTMPFTFTRR